MGIVTEYPFWFILLCLLAGAIFSFLLYFRINKADINLWLIRLLAILRFIAVTLVAFLLLSPLLKKTSEIIEKPLILFAQDNSVSVVSTKDSAYYRKIYPENIKKFLDKIARKNEIVTYAFGEKLSNGYRTSFTEKATDLSGVFHELISRYSNRNIGALIIASDGLYNKGSNPVYSARKMAYPVYTIALGDTLLVKDIILKKTMYNRTVFLGDKFPVEIHVQANKCSGETAEVSIVKNKQALQRKTVSFQGEKAFRKVTFTLDANEKGIQHYSVTVTPADNEISHINNNAEIFIDVKDIKQKIALLYQTPHPDISALRSAIEVTMKYDLTVKKINEFNENPESFDLIILYQLPSMKEITAISRFLPSGASLLFVLGSQTDLPAFNNLKTGLQVISSKNNFSESLASFNQDFALFTSDKEMLESVKDFPPLLSPFGTYQFSPVSEILFYQKIGNVISGTPLVMFVNDQSKKTGIISGENIWKWKLTNYLRKANHDAFNELVSKIVQYLVIKEDKSLFRVKCNERFGENETVSFEAELYNESYEMINHPDVSLTIRDEENRSFPFLFGKSEKSYFLNAGSFPVGKYTYSASVRVGRNVYQKSGAFVIHQMNLETMNMIADHNLMFRLSGEHGGEMFYPENLDYLADTILSREDIRPVIYTQKRFSDLVGNLWIFLVIILLFTTEWFIRKRNGIY